LDGTFASFNEKRVLTNMSPTAFAASMANVANIPAASAPVATFAQDLSPHLHIHRPQPLRPHHEHTRSQSSAEDAALAATVKSVAGSTAQSPVNKLVKRKLMKSTKSSKRVVHLDDGDYDRAMEDNADTGVKGLESLMSEDEELAGPTVKFSSNVLGSPAAIVKKKKKKSSKVTTSTTDAVPETDTAIAAAEHIGSTLVGGNGTAPVEGQEQPVFKEKVKRRVPKKKNALLPNVTFATESEKGQDDDLSIDHSLCMDNHHVHRLAHLEKSMATIQLERAISPVPGASSSHTRQPSRGILKRAGTMGPDYGRAGAISPVPQRPSSPIGSFCSDDGGADGYRRRIQAMRSEAGHNWLMVLAEMNAETKPDQDQTPQFTVQR